MEILTVIMQILGFPGLFLVLAIILAKSTSNNNRQISNIGQAMVFSISAYIINTLVLFPMWFIFKPEEVNGMFFLKGLNVYAFWIISIFIVTPIVYGFSAYLLYFKKVTTEYYIKSGALLGLFTLIWSLFFEIVIYVYMRKTIPSIQYYFFGKNFPWIDMNWIVCLAVPIIVAYMLKRRKLKQN